MTKTKRRPRTLRIVTPIGRLLQPHQQGVLARDFASALNVSDKTVKAWEQGIKPPGSSALRLLEIIERHPEVSQMETAD